MVLILSCKEVTSLIRHCITPFELLANQARVFQALCTSTSNNTKQSNEFTLDAPHRITLSLRNATTLFMPARVANEVTCKIVSVPKQGSGLAASTVVLDDVNGSLKALVNATSLTALRTAAGSALATLAVQGKPSDSKKHITVFGSGQQALYHANFFSFLLQVNQLDFVSRSNFPKQTLEELKQMGTQCDSICSILSEDRLQVEESVSRADIIICCTPSLKPLFSSKWVRPGAHVVLIGSYKPTMQEVETELVERAQGRIIVDDVEACSLEAGDLIKANVTGEQCIPLGLLLNHEALTDLSQGRTDTLPSAEAILTLFKGLDKDANRGERIGDVTMFKSVGIGLQDVAITSLVVAKAIEEGKGIQVDF